MFLLKSYTCQVHNINQRDISKRRVVPPRNDVTSCDRCDLWLLAIQSSFFLNPPRLGFGSVQTVTGRPLNKRYCLVNTLRVNLPPTPWPAAGLGSWPLTRPPAAVPANALVVELLGWWRLCLPSSFSLLSLSDSSVVRPLPHCCNEPSKEQRPWNSHTFI